MRGRRQAHVFKRSRGGKRTRRERDPPRAQRSDGRRQRRQREGSDRTQRAARRNCWPTQRQQQQQQYPHHHEERSARGATPTAPRGNPAPAPQPAQRAHRSPLPARPTSPPPCRLRFPCVCPSIRCGFLTVCQKRDGAVNAVEQLALAQPLQPPVLRPIAPVQWGSQTRLHHAAQNVRGSLTVQGRSERRGKGGRIAQPRPDAQGTAAVASARSPMLARSGSARPSSARWLAPVR